MADLREAYRTSLLAKPTVYVLAATRDEQRVQAVLTRQSVTSPAGSILPCGARDGEASKMDSLAMLARRHPGATIRYVDDSAHSLHAAANDVRLFALTLHYAAWGHSTLAQQACAASMPRVTSLHDPRALESVFKVPKKDGVGYRGRRRYRRLPPDA